MHKPKMRKATTPQGGVDLASFITILLCTVNKILQGEQLFSRVPLLDELSS